MLLIFVFYIPKNNLFVIEASSAGHFSVVTNKLMSIQFKFGDLF